MGSLAKEGLVFRSALPAFGVAPGTEEGTGGFRPQSAACGSPGITHRPTISGTWIDVLGRAHPRVSCPASPQMSPCLGSIPPGGGGVAVYFRDKACPTKSPDAAGIRAYH